MRSNLLFKTSVAALLALVCAAFASPASASTSLSYDFNSDGELAANFNSYASGASPSWSSSGGISDSGSISAPGTFSAVYAAKSAFSIGPVGSTYVFTAYMKSVGNGGYSGMGFTASLPGSTTASGNPYRPNDALGVSVHGGGFAFHSAASNFWGNWSGGGDPALTQTVASANGALLNSGSPDSWYKVVFTAVRDSATTFDSKVEVWPVNSAGTLLESSASAIYELNNQAVSGLINAPIIYAYFNLSGDRVYNFDNFSVNLSGGASVIDEGAPVVLTDAVADNSGVLDLDGTVTSAGDSAVIERGFVISTDPEPDLGDTVIVVSGTTGAFSGQSASLAAGTYYIRAYATNSSGTSYGSEISITVTSSGGGGDSGGGSSGSDGTSNLASTGFDVIPVAVLGGLAVFGGVILLSRRRNRHNH
jgi:uncharacterized membrane protein YgcG